MTVIDAVRADPRPVLRIRARRARPVGYKAPSTPWVAKYRAVLVASDLAVALAVSTATAAATGQWWVLLALPTAWVLLGLHCGAYRPNVLGAGAHDLRAVALAGVITLALLSVAAAIGWSTPRHGAIVLAAGAITVLACGVRSIGRIVIKARRRRGSCVQRVLIVGDASAVVDMVERLGRATSAMGPVGVVVPADELDQVGVLELPVRALSIDAPEAAVEMAGELGADAVVLVAGTLPNPALRAVSRVCEWTGLDIMFAPTIVDVATSAPVTPVAGLPILSVPRPGPAGAGGIGKRVIDRLGAVIGLAVLLPVFLFVAAAIRLDSRGPVFFRQTRVGGNGRPFRMIKFRTMSADAEERLPDLKHLNESDGPLFKLKSDPRVTRVGGVLRRLSLDELPQLSNVLLGQMSLVGPRPPLPDEVAGYTLAERRRLLVSPGMTGLWQVGGRSNLGWADSIRLDLSYVESWSLPLDIRILAKTIPEVLRRRGAF